MAANLLDPSELALYSKSRKGRQVVVTTMRKLAREAKMPVEQAMQVGGTMGGKKGGREGEVEGLLVALTHKLTSARSRCLFRWRWSSSRRGSPPEMP